MPAKIDTAIHSKIEAALRAGERPMALLEKYGVSRSMVYKVAYSNGIAIKKPKDTTERDAKRASRRKQVEEWRLRDEEIAHRFKLGETLEAIGADYGITRERVRQIAYRAGLKPRNVEKAEQFDAMRATLSQKPLTPDAAAEALGVGRSEVLRIARMLDVKLDIRRAWDTPEVAELAELVRHGHSIRSAANGNRKMERWLAEYCRHHGVKLYHGRWPSRSYPRPVVVSSGFRTSPVRVARERQPEIVEAARASYGKEPASVVAARCGVTRNTIIGYWFRLRQKGEL